MNLTLNQLKEAVSIKEQIAALEIKLAKILGASAPALTAKPVRRKKGAVKAEKAVKSAKPAKKTKRVMSPEARAKISAAATKRWAAQKKV